MDYLLHLVVQRFSSDWIRSLPGLFEQVPHTRGFAWMMGGTSGVPIVHREVTAGRSPTLTWARPSTMWAQRTRYVVYAAGTLGAGTSVVTYGATPDEKYGYEARASP